MIISLEIVKPEVGTVDGELMGKEVTRHYEKQQGEDNGRACSQMECVLEWSEVV